MYANQKGHEEVSKNCMHESYRYYPFELELAADNRRVDVHRSHIVDYHADAQALTIFKQMR
jgi:hypothetical protein